MVAYPKDYLSDVVENQGKLFDYVAYTYPNCDTEDFIKSYMTSKTRKSIDQLTQWMPKNFGITFAKLKTIL